MARRRAWVGGMSLGLALFCVQPVQAFIEKLTPLKDIIADSDYIYVAKVDAVDPEKPAAVLKIDKDLKGKAPFRRMPINLTGNKEKHTPHLLKRIAPELPVVVFVTELDKRHLVLAYTNGTWFQVIGQADGKDVRWAFTHCEIYLRRTFKGTTAEMLQVLNDVLEDKKKAPDPHPKEPPGFGPEIEMKPGCGTVWRPCHNRGPCHNRDADQGSVGRGGSLFGVIALPFLAPVAAILQLLFPGLLREQWRQYRIAVSIMLTQSTLLLVHFILTSPSWLALKPAWWLGQDVLWAAIVVVALLGAVAACVSRLRQARANGTVPHRRPVRVEFCALGILALAGLGWLGYVVWSGDSPLDQMAVVTVAAIAGVSHLVYRRLRAAEPLPGRALLTTEMVFLWSLVLVGTGLGMYLYQPAEPNRRADPVVAEWLTFRGNAQRTGAAHSSDYGPHGRSPTVLWTFAPKERKGTVRFYSSPTVVDQQIYVGAQLKVLSAMEGRVYCIGAADGRPVQEDPLWRFRAEQTGYTLRPVFSSPTVAAGQIIVGEGYHEDKSCRLFCLSAQSADEVLWAKMTRSHVESSACVVKNRVYFGAGDDGLLCVDTNELEEPNEAGEPRSPRTLWRYGKVHVDASPLVVDNLVFAGSVVGDELRDLCAVAVDAETGEEVWRVDTPLPLPGSPAYADGRVFFALGNGKFNKDDDRPAGGIWCLDAKSGRRLWEYGVSNPAEVGNSVLGTPALMDGKVFFGSRDGHCYGLQQQDGRRIWKVDVGAPVVASPVAAAGKVYVVTIFGAVSCLDAATGQIVWRFTPEQLDEALASNPVDDVYSSPTLANGRLYLCVGGKLYCIGDPP